MPLRYSLFRYPALSGVHTAYASSFSLCSSTLMCSYCRCIIAMITCFLSYYSQPFSSSRPALLFQLPSTLTAEHTTGHTSPSNVEHHSLGPGVTHDKDASSTDASAPPSSPSSPLTASYTDSLQLPPAALFLLCHLLVLVILRFILVVRSIARLRWPRRASNTNAPTARRLDEESITLTPYTVDDIDGLRDVIPPVLGAVNISSTTVAPLQDSAGTMASDCTQGCDCSIGTVASTIILGSVLTQEPEEIDTNIVDQEPHQPRMARLNKRPKRCAKKQSGSTGWLRPSKSGSNSLNASPGSGSAVSHSTTKDCRDKGKVCVPKTVDNKEKDGREDSLDKTSVRLEFTMGCRQYHYVACETLCLMAGQCISLL
jgi:hypothetical protein